jgi:hypothetical protein
MAGGTLTISSSTAPAIMTRAVLHSVQTPGDPITTGTAELAAAANPGEVVSIGVPRCMGMDFALPD